MDYKNNKYINYIQLIIAFGILIVYIFTDASEYFRQNIWLKIVWAILKVYSLGVIVSSYSMIKERAQRSNKNGRKIFFKILSVFFLTLQILVGIAILWVGMGYAADGEMIIARKLRIVFIVYAAALVFNIVRVIRKREKPSEYDDYDDYSDYDME